MHGAHGDDGAFIGFHASSCDIVVGELGVGACGFFVFGPLEWVRITAESKKDLGFAFMGKQDAFFC